MTLQALGRPLYLAIGWVCVAFGGLGIIIPLFPTTPFLLVAVWAFSRSSPELAARIRNHRLVGPMIRNWQDAGVIPVKAKLAAYAMMAAMLAYVHFLAGPPLWLELGFALALLLAVGFVATRPGSKPD